MLRQHTRTEAQRLLVTAVGTTADVEAEIGFHTNVLCQHVQRGSEGPCAVGTGAHAALDLHGLHTAGEVAHVYPKDRGALCIV